MMCLCISKVCFLPFVSNNVRFHETETIVRVKDNDVTLSLTELSSWVGIGPESDTKLRENSFQVSWTIAAGREREVSTNKSLLWARRKGPIVDGGPKGHGDCWVCRHSCWVTAPSTRDYNQDSHVQVDAHTLVKDESRHPFEMMNAGEGFSKHSEAHTRISQPHSVLMSLCFPFMLRHNAAVSWLPLRNWLVSINTKLKEPVCVEKSTFPIEIQSSLFSRRSWNFILDSCGPTGTESRNGCGEIHHIQLIKMKHSQIFMLMVKIITNDLIGFSRRVYSSINLNQIKLYL